MRIVRWILLLILIIGLVWFWWVKHTTLSARCLGCNVVIITIDSLRPDALPCYGYTLNTAPNLCSFAAKNILFSEAFATSSWTLPSEMSLFTGLYPTSHGMGTAMRNTLNPSIPTLSKIFTAAGYQTIAITNIQPNVGLEQGLGRGFQSVRLSQDAIEQASSDLMTAIDDMKAANAHHKPVFVYFHTDSVHNYNFSLPSAPSFYTLDPLYHSPSIMPNIFSFTTETWNIMKDRLEYMANVANDPRYSDWSTRAANGKSLSEAKRLFESLPPQDQSAIMWERTTTYVQKILGTAYPPLARHMYDEAIRVMDTYIGKVLDRLADQKLLNNTIVIITAEHGEYLGEQGRFGHGTTLVDLDTHVPLIMHVPRAPSFRTDNLISLIDIYATLVELLGLHVQAPESSISQSKRIWSPSSAPQRPFIISEWDLGSWGNVYNRDRSIRTSQWRLIEKTSPAGTETALYNLATNAFSVTNVANAHPETVASLSALLQTTLNRQPIYTPIRTSFPDWIDDEHRKKLIQTGYF